MKTIEKFFNTIQTLELNSRFARAHLDELRRLFGEYYRDPDSFGASYPLTLTWAFKRITFDIIYQQNYAEFNIDDAVECQASCNKGIPAAFLIGLGRALVEEKEEEEKNENL